MVSTLASGPSYIVFESQRSQYFPEEKIVDVAEVMKWSWPEESEQWLENVGQTHLGLASGKLVLQNMFLLKIFLRREPCPGQVYGCELKKHIKLGSSQAAHISTLNGKSVVNSI